MHEVHLRGEEAHLAEAVWPGAMSTILKGGAVRLPFGAAACFWAFGDCGGATKVGDSPWDAAVWMHSKIRRGNGHLYEALISSMSQLRLQHLWTREDAWARALRESIELRALQEPEPSEHMRSSTRWIAEGDRIGPTIEMWERFGGARDFALDVLRICLDFGMILEIRDEMFAERVQRAGLPVTTEGSDGN